MHQNHEQLRAMTAPVVQALSAIPKMTAVLCFGSYAAGTADADSDVDLYVLCHPEVASLPVRQAALHALPGISELALGIPDAEGADCWCRPTDRFRLDGMVFEVGYQTVDWLHAVVTKVSEEGATSLPELRFRPYTMLGLLDSAVVLFDPDGVVQALKSRLYPYPAKLRAALLRESRQTLAESLAELDDYVRRGVGNTAFHFHLERVLDALQTLLFALNQRHHPAAKRVEEAYRGLPLLPPDFLARYTAVLETPLTPPGRQHVARELRLLVQESERRFEAETRDGSPSGQRE